MYSIGIVVAELINNLGYPVIFSVCACFSDDSFQARVRESALLPRLKRGRTRELLVSACHRACRSADVAQKGPFPQGTLSMHQHMVGFVEAGVTCQSSERARRPRLSRGRIDLGDETFTTRSFESCLRPGLRRTSSLNRDVRLSSFSVNIANRAEAGLTEASNIKLKITIHL